MFHFFKKYYNQHPESAVDDVRRLEHGENEELVRVGEQPCRDHHRGELRGQDDDPCRAALLP